MAIFIIDINLPYYFGLWNSPDFVHVRDLNFKWSDEEIWKYSKENDLTIISKDVDFSNKIFLNVPPPKVIHIQFGNLKAKVFHKVMTEFWNKILELNANHKLVNVFIDRIEAIE
jgi:predicted nuclease of predicted toxin-antitoxin system